MTNLKHIYSVDQNYASILELLYELHKDMDKVIDIYFEKFQPVKPDCILQDKPVNPYADIISTCRDYSEVKRLKDLYQNSREMIKYHSDKRLYKNIMGNYYNLRSSHYYSFRTFVSDLTGFHNVIFSEVYSKCENWIVPSYMKQLDRELGNFYSPEGFKLRYKLYLQFVEDFNNHINIDNL